MARVNYQRRCLTGNAVSVIAGIQAIHDSYNGSISILTMRFSGTRTIEIRHPIVVPSLSGMRSGANKHVLPELYDFASLNYLFISSGVNKKGSFHNCLWDRLHKALHSNALLDTTIGNA